MSDLDPATLAPINEWLTRAYGMTYTAASDEERRTLRGCLFQVCLEMDRLTALADDLRRERDALKAGKHAGPWVERPQGWVRYPSEQVPRERGCHAARVLRAASCWEGRAYPAGYLESRSVTADSPEEARIALDDILLQAGWYLEGDELADPMASVHVPDRNGVVSAQLVGGDGGVRSVRVVAPDGRLTDDQRRALDWALRHVLLAERSQLRDENERDEHCATVLRAMLEEL